MNKKTGISFFTLSLCLYLNSAELIIGDKDAQPGETFSFNVNKNIISSIGNFYEGALHNILNNQEFAFSRLMRDAQAFAPLAPEHAVLNNVPDSINPLFGAGIIALSLFEVEDGFSTRDIPLVVTENKQANVYMIENISNQGNVTIVSSEDIFDAQGNVSNGILDMTTDITSHIFAAAKPNNGQFGDLFSGIALLIRGSLNDQRVFGQIDAATGAAVENPQSLLLDPTSPVLNIQSSLLGNIVPNIVSLHWSTSLQILFIGLEVTANSTINDGARAVALCSFKKGGGIQLQAIAPDSAFDNGNTNNIIGVRGANQQISIHAINSLYTSTALNYLIVVGGNGNATSTQQSVFALPLVNTGDAKGTIAQKSATPHNIFQDANVPRLIARTIDAAATTQADMPQATDVATQVGGGKLTAGPIVNIITRDDTVFAFVGNNTDTNNPGVYSSQALFDASGKITSWTAWQRAAGTTDQIFGCILEASRGNFILASGTTHNDVKTVKRTLWSDGSPTGLLPLTTILDNTFPSNNGGIQGLQTFLPNTPGLNNISAIAAGGIGNVLVTQTGILNSNGIIIPTPATNTNTVIIADDALKNIGPITALEFARNATNGWLFVGGSNGLAILANNDGSGWNAATELNNNLQGLTHSMQFHTVGNYQFVQKLIYDDNFLYVITHSTIDRINLTPTHFDFTNNNATTIATAGLNGITSTGGFLDGIFSQACGIIATTDGLMRVGDNKDIRTVLNETDANWTDITIPENAGAPTALYAVTSTNRAQDITRNSGGFFYVLSANVGLNQSRINRFAVQPLTSTDTVNAQTVQAFDDLFVKNIPSFLLSFGEFRSNFATDGALYFATRNQNIKIPPIALLTPSFPVPRVGVGNIGDMSIPVKINFQNGTEINAFTRSQASGSWITAGNFKTQVLE
jgi:hypothetical protein